MENDNGAQLPKSPDAIMKEIASKLRDIFPVMDITFMLDDESDVATISASYSTFTNISTAMSISFYESLGYDELKEMREKGGRIDAKITTIRTIISRALDDCRPTL